MTDRQSNSLDMFLVVRTFHTDNAAVIDVVPARAAAFGLHATNITAINAIASAQSGNITGIATDKAVLRNALDTLTFEHFTAALAWARNQSNNTLAAEFDYTQSDIEKVKDDSIIAFCQHRYQIINDNSAALADYGIFATTLAAWQTAMTAYEPLVPGPRSARVSKKVLTAQLKTLFKQTNDHLRNILDPLMLALRSSQPALYLGYQSSRIIIDLRGPGDTPAPPPPPPPAVQPMNLTGQARHSLTNAPLFNVEVTVMRTSGDVTVFTDAGGNYAANGMEVTLPEIVQVRFRLAGFADRMENITLVPGVNQVLNVTMTPPPLPPPPPPAP